MQKEKLSRTTDWIVTLILAIVIGMVANLFVPYPAGAPSWATVMLASIRYYITAAAIMILSKKHLHFEPAKLLSESGRFKVLRMVSFALIWIALLSLFALFKYLLHQDQYSMASGYRFFSPMLLAILLFTPVQTFTEELIFRCMLSRIPNEELPKERGKVAALSLASGFLFAMAHVGSLNADSIGPSVKSLLFYFILGSFLMLLGIITGGFEASIGIHMGNNLFIDLAVCQSLSVQIKNPLILYSGSETYLLLAELAFCIAGTCLLIKLTTDRNKNNG